MELTEEQLASQLKNLTPEAANQIVRFMSDKFPGDEGSKSIVAAWMQFALTNPELLKAQGLVPAADSMPLSEVILFAEWIARNAWVHVDEISEDKTKRGIKWYTRNPPTAGLSTPDLIKAFKNRNV
jgi:hypothetical protein